MSHPQTTIRGHWPISNTANTMKTKTPTAMPKNTQPKQAGRFIPLETLHISSDPLPVKRAAIKHHYDPLFNQLKPGQRIICQPEQAHSLSNALRAYLKRSGKMGRAKSCERYEKDGMGGVWWVEEAA